MKNILRVLGLISMFICIDCIGQEHSIAEVYTFKKDDPNGIGKWYMGREIAHVMGYQGIGWLERPEREKEEDTTTLLKNMGMNSEDVIADIGAGSGYHVFRMAPMVSQGSIFAVDIQEEMLAAIEKKREGTSVQNIKTVQGSEKSVNLEENSIDKVLLVDVYHEFSYPKEIMLSIIRALRSNGRLYLVEYRGEDASVPIKKIHKMTEAQAVKELQAVGLRLEKNINNLPWQHCMVFVKE